MRQGRGFATACAAMAVGVVALTAGGGGCSKGNDSAPDASAFLASLADAGDAMARLGGDGGYDDTAMPTAVDDDLQQRMRHLLEAVSQNNPDLANDALFPRDGYVQAKESADPQKAWDKGVSASFKRSVERQHKHLKGVENAKYMSFELGHAILQLPPSKKNFKKALWRVRHSKIRFSVEGKERSLDIAEMTAWRGAWYVTKLR